MVKGFKRFCIIAITFVVVFSSISFKGANAEMNVSNSEDGFLIITKIASLYNLRSGDIGFLSKYDLNKDNIINIFDIVLAAKDIEEDFTLDGIDASSLSSTINYWWYKTNINHQVPEVNLNLPYDINKYDTMYVGDTTKKVLYLTFDTEYKTNNITKILNVLNENNVKANFFVISYFIDNNKELINKIANDGHLVGNHTDSHSSLVDVANDKAKFEDEIKRVEKKYKAATGKNLARFLRAPYGQFSEKSLRYTNALGYKNVFWSFSYVDYDDSNQPSEEMAKKTILENLHNGAILLLHASSDTNAAVLDEVIKEAKNQGYSFELLR